MVAGVVVLALVLGCRGGGGGPAVGGAVTLLLLLLLLGGGPGRPGPAAAAVAAAGRRSSSTRSRRCSHPGRSGSAAGRRSRSGRPGRSVLLAAGRRRPAVAGAVALAVLVLLLGGGPGLVAQLVAVPILDMHLVLGLVPVPDLILIARLVLQLQLLALLLDDAVDLWAVVEEALHGVAEHPGGSGPGGGRSQGHGAHEHLADDGRKQSGEHGSPPPESAGGGCRDRHECRHRGLPGGSCRRGHLLARRRRVGGEGSLPPQAFDEGGQRLQTVRCPSSKERLKVPVVQVAHHALVTDEEAAGVTGAGRAGGSRGRGAAAP